MILIPRKWAFLIMSDFQEQYDILEAEKNQIVEEMEIKEQEIKKLKRKLKTAKVRGTFPLSSCRSLSTLQFRRLSMILTQWD